MKTFKSIDIFKIVGRGTVICVEVPNPKRERRPEGTPNVNETVLIDGQKYIVKGIEISMKLMNPEFQGSSVGLLVKKLEDDNNE